MDYNHQAPPPFLMKRKGKVYYLHTFQCLPLSLAEAWSFFSNPSNLASITPSWLDFTLLSDEKELSAIQGEIRPGMIIRYRIRPILHLPVQWITEITQVHKPYLFVDEQRWGPYRFWHHQHLFQPIQRGVAIQDIVYYAFPLGPFGRLSHALLFRKRLEDIFVFRRLALEQRFGMLPSS